MLKVPNLTVAALLLSLLGPQLTLAATPGSVSAASGAVRVEPTNLDQVSVVWSPKSTAVAYLQRKAAGSGIFNIHVKELGSSVAARQITTDGDNVSGFSPPIWSPDGKWLGFLTIEGFYKTASLRGSGVSTTVAVGQTCFGGNAGRTALDGKHYIVNKRGGDISLLRIQPNGSFVGLDPIGTAVRVTAFNSLPGALGERRITADQSSIAFAVNLAGGRSSLHLLTGVGNILSGAATAPTSLGSAGVTTLTTGAVFDSLGDFTSDGTLLFVGTRATFTPAQDCPPNSETPSSLFGTGATFDIASVATDGSGARAAVAALNTGVRHEVLPSPSPDGMRIAFVRDEGSVFQVYTADLAYSASVGVAGGNRTVTDGSGSSVTIPDNALAVSTNLSISLASTIPDALGVSLPTGFRPVVVARDIRSTGGSSLNQNATIRIGYADEQIVGLDPASLTGFRFDTITNSWQRLTTISVDQAAKQVVFVTSQFSVFGLSGTVPTVAAAGTTGGGASGQGGGCALPVRDGARGAWEDILSLLLLTSPLLFLLIPRRRLSLCRRRVERR